MIVAPSSPLRLRESDGKTWCSGGREPAVESAQRPPGRPAVIPAGLSLSGLRACARPAAPPSPAPPARPGPAAVGQRREGPARDQNGGVFAPGAGEGGDVSSVRSLARQ